MSHPAVGTMTPEQARANVEAMAAIFSEHRGAEGTVAAVEAAMDSIRTCAKEAPSEAHRRDYREMWNAGRALRSEALAAAPAPRSLGTVAPRDEKPGLDDLAELERRAAPGYYAIDGDEDTPIRFYRLDIPTEGRWAGSVFVKQVTGHVGEEGTRVKHPARRVEVLAAIEAAGPVEAAKRYGQEIGRCSRCHRVLTNEESRAYGIGPECRSK